MTDAVDYQSWVHPDKPGDVLRVPPFCTMIIDHEFVGISRDRVVEQLIEKGWVRE